jgi:hypothetical protein
MWTTDRAITKNDIPNGMSRIQLVEVNGTGIAWTEPRDLSLAEVLDAITCGDAKEPPCPHPEGTLAILANASTVWLKKDATKDELRALFTLDKGERRNPRQQSNHDDPKH